VMIEPPRQIMIGRVFEIDDDIDVAVEKAVFEELISAVSQTRVHKFGVWIELAF